MNEITVNDLDDLALGAVFLATGGGGDPHLPRLIAEQALKAHGPVRLIAPSDLADTDFVVPIGSVGAPTVALELLPSVEDAANTLAAFEQHIGRRADALASFEIGGGNSLIPLMAAAASGLPVIDGDGMGRAFPEAQMMTYAIGGVRPTPALAYDYAGNTAVFNTATTEVYEYHIRSFAAAAGGMVTVAEHAMSGVELKRAVIPGTVSFSSRLGKILRENRGEAPGLVAVLQRTFDQSVYGQCRYLFAGKVIVKSTRIIGGYDIGETRIEDFDDPASVMTINIKNEYLLAKIGAQVVASVPDLVVILDYETSTPINCERLRFGQRVAVFAIGCPAFYRSAAALKVTSPRCFGFDIDYTPLEKLPC